MSFDGCEKYENIYYTSQISYSLTLISIKIFQLESIYKK